MEYPQVSGKLGGRQEVLKGEQMKTESHGEDWGENG